MTDYQKPCHMMVDAAERAIAQLDALNVGTAKAILIQGERDAEEAYLTAGEEKEGKT